MLRLAALAAVAAVASATCTVGVAPCDTSYGSRLNQTFAYYGVSPNAVQLVGYWSDFHACVGAAVTIPNATGAATFSLAECSARGSAWFYGPGDLQSYAFYNNTATGTCLSVRNAPNGTASLGLEPCCAAAGASCKSNDKARQMWLEPPSHALPYNTIRTLFADGAAPGGYCLTKFGSC